MRLRGEEYTERLEAFSDSTLVLISEIMSFPKEVYEKGRNITTNSELNEEQVVEALKKLKAEHEARTPR